MHSKADLFTDELAELAELAKALAHPARLQILQVLARKGTCICGELVDAVPLAQPSVSRHLKALKEAGLVRGEVDGPRSCYCVDIAALRRLQAAFGVFFAGLPSIETDDASCC